MPIDPGLRGPKSVCLFKYSKALFALNSMSPPINDDRINKIIKIEIRDDLGNNVFCIITIFPLFLYPFYNILDFILSQY